MLEGLNDHQLNAVVSENNTLVLACPGSGKTRVLTRKIAYELDRLESKKKFIVALTFTNRAAEEIQKRIDELGIPQEQLWAGTIHSFCHQWVIKPYAEAIPELVNGFSIIDDFKKNSILNHLKDKYSLPAFQSISTSLDREGNYIEKEPLHKMIAEVFHKSILENKELDFDLILYFSYRLLEKHEKIRRHLSHLFSYILVDEYQDTSDLQYGIIGQIIKQSNNECRLFLVGDSDQAIYNSLGGVSKSLEEICEEIGSVDMEQLVLPGNYRSTQRIVNFFENFQSENVNIQALGRHSDEIGLISLDHSIDKDNLPNEIARIITHYLNNGLSPNEICVIAPQWYFLTPIAKKLRSLLPNVPLEAPGSTPLPRNKENFWWKLSRLFLTEVNPQNSLNRFRWVRQVFQAINDYTNESFGLEHNDCRKYLKLINSIVPDGNKGISYLELAFKEFFLALDIDFNNHPTLNDQWNTFFNGIRRRYESPEFNEVPDDITYFKNMFKPSSGVVINTCHGVKGEEYETVIAFGLLWGYIPHWNIIINESQDVANSSSRNLLYVIGSRAKMNLHLFAETGRSTQAGRPYRINDHLAATRFEYDFLPV